MLHPSLIALKRSQGKPAGRGFDGPRSGFASFGGFGGAASGSSLSYLAEPPSSTAVSDPNVVVALKNILKKDSTTKAKALEELLAYVQAHPFDQDGGVEEAILDVWVSGHGHGQIMYVPYRVANTLNRSSYILALR